MEDNHAGSRGSAEIDISLDVIVADKEPTFIDAFKNILTAASTV